MMLSQMDLELMFICCKKCPHYFQILYQYIFPGKDNARMCISSPLFRNKIPQQGQDWEEISDDPQDISPGDFGEHSWPSLCVRNVWEELSTFPACHLPCQAGQLMSKKYPSDYLIVECQEYVRAHWCFVLGWVLISERKVSAQETTMKLRWRTLQQ